MKIAVVSITRHGIAMAQLIVAALPDAQLIVPEKFAAEAGHAAECYTGALSAQMAGLFARFDGIVAVFSVGTVVRLIAPHLVDKTRDPAVVVVDECGRFVIPVLSGHLGGANALAGWLAHTLDATAVLTTASDARQTLAVDLLGHELGWRLDASHQALVHASAAVVNDEPVALVQEAGSRDWWPAHANGRNGPLPANLQLFSRLEDINPAHFSAVLWISHRDMPYDYANALTGRCVIYRPGETE
jgi:cobalt-precorrin 5A hydrolase